MDYLAIFVSVLSSSVFVTVSSKLWDSLAEKKKNKKEEKKLLNTLLYQFTLIYDTGNRLKEQFALHSERISFVTEFAEPHIDNLNNIYMKIDETLLDLAKLDPYTAAGLRHSHYNDASYSLFVLKKFVLSVKDRVKELPKEKVISELKLSKKETDGSLKMLLEIARISMYIIASKIDKETLEMVSEKCPDKKLIAEFLKR